jgi:hypothetical protein
MTTKNDLLRDLLKDLLINLDYNFDPSDDGDSEEGAEIIMDEKIEEMLSVMEDLDQNATNMDFNVKVITKKVGDK